MANIINVGNLKFLTISFKRPKKVYYVALYIYKTHSILAASINLFHIRKHKGKSSIHKFAPKQNLALRCIFFRAQLNWAHEINLVSCS